MRRVSLLLVALLGLVVAAPLVWRSTLAATQRVPAAQPGQVQSARWQQSGVDEWNNGTLDGLVVSNNAGGELRLDRDSQRGAYTSAAFEAPFAFTALAVEWLADLPATTALTIEFRTGPNNQEWHDWQPLPTATRPGASGTQVLGPVGVETDSRWLQYRILFSTGAQPAVPVVEEASWVLLDSSQGPTLLDQPGRAPAFSATPSLTRAPLVIGRAGWGAAELAPDLTPSRPRQLALVALPLAASADPPTLLRALQAIVQSSGGRDIPYAYLVDSAGNIYQGRAGLPAVDGVISVALLGEPTAAAQAALAQTLAWLAQANSISLDLSVVGALTPAQAEEIRAQADRAMVRSRWTFVESNTRDYNERLMFFNPTSKAASATITFLPGQANSIQRELTIDPGQRVNLILNEVFSDTASIPLEVTANQEIVAERTMLFGNDALGEPGIQDFSRSWYFAEGDAGSGRRTTLMLYNPQAADVEAEVLVIGANSLTRTQSLILEPFASQAVEVSADLTGQFGFRVVASAPIAAERTMLFGVNERGGFLTRGATAPATAWYFAEGATIAPFDTSLALLNPGPLAAAITTTFMTEEGSTFTRRYQLPPLSRLSVEMRDIVPSPQGVGTAVTASQPIVAERTTYFNNGNSGTNTVGARKLAYSWRFAEGRTTDPATEFILIANPNPRPANITLWVGKTDGTRTSFEFIVPRTGRIAILLDNLVDGETSHSTIVDSSMPVVAERTILIANDEGGGGHSAMGTPER